MKRLLIIVLLSLSLPVLADKAAPRWEGPPKEITINNRNGDVDRSANAAAEASSVSGAHAASASGAEAVSIAGDSSASNGDQISMNSSQFYALSLMFPNAVDCFQGAQGGGQDASGGSGKSGFLGFHFLNKSCWLQKQASMEADIEINALLKCGDTKYRNAITYDMQGSRRVRTKACVDKLVESGQERMRQWQEEVARVETESQARDQALENAIVDLDEEQKLRIRKIFEAGRVTEAK